MLRHQFGQNLILRLDLLLQIRDSSLFGLMVGPSSLLESRSSVLEELLLPTIEDGRLKSPFVTQIRDRHSFHQMPPQNGCFFFRRVVLPLLLHVFAPLS
jgi:hypothetical protein